MFRLLVAGGRGFYNYRLLDSTLTNWLERYTDTKGSLKDGSEGANGTPPPDKDITLVHGDSNGADKLAAMWAFYNDLEVEPHPANWKRHGVGAGPIRNLEMALSGIDFAILFPGGVGTDNMRKILVNNGINFEEVVYTTTT